MRPPSYDEFIKQGQDDHHDFSTDDPEPFVLVVCPVPGCKSKGLHAEYEEGLVQGFSCDMGCSFIAKRNAFTNDLIYYTLKDFKQSRFNDAASMQGMKFNPLGEIYTDWY